MRTARICLCREIWEMRHTDPFVHHVNLQGEVLAVDAMLRGRVEMELCELELRAAKGGSSIDDDFDGSVEIFELDSLLGNV